jgi:hypothetical protein
MLELAKPVFGKRTPNLSIELETMQVLSRRKESICAGARQSAFMQAPPGE